MTARADLPDPTDIPHGAASPSQSAASVWLGHRAGTLDVTRFGVGAGIDLGGDWFVHGHVIREVAHRFGDELLLWDVWGAMHPASTTLPWGHRPGRRDRRPAGRVRRGDLAAENELLRRYRDDACLHPGSRVTTMCPTGVVYDVDLVVRTNRPRAAGTT